ncbi:hypothetical protein GMRT_14304 [Giardia muris]|uniref:Uncharacterized protein n=1 Tax=Giardia muris TaxID=5742 RepID=A0A4Z1SZH9_GIAMU|nr:hypothetical protein GMRT_14304 [Giardia muris]|eukprot:TNJ30155.1 hypothetical protein GMRT_14304 [Giardia muris]
MDSRALRSRSAKGTKSAPLKYQKLEEMICQALGEIEEVIEDIAGSNDALDVQQTLSIFLEQGLVTLDNRMEVDLLTNHIIPTLQSADGSVEKTSILYYRAAILLTELAPTTCTNVDDLPEAFKAAIARFTLPEFINMALELRMILASSTPATEKSMARKQMTPTKRARIPSTQSTDTANFQPEINPNSAALAAQYWSKLNIEDEGVYARVNAWTTHKKDFLKQRRKEHIAAETIVNTFQPSRSSSHDGCSDSDVEARAADRLYSKGLNHMIRSKQLSDQLRLQREEEELRECTFVPTTNSGRSGGRLSTEPTMLPSQKRSIEESVGRMRAAYESQNPPEAPRVWLTSTQLAIRARERERERRGAKNESLGLPTKTEQCPTDDCKAPSTAPLVGATTPME